MKKGAASFYVVAFSTLILVIIVTSFAAIIISEVARTSNDDLAQSAYDSALAGVEDAKLAFYNYRNCAGSASIEPNGDGEVTCGEIMWYMEHPDCDMVAHILGRIGEKESSEVMIEETQSMSNNMYQAYTCVKLDTILTDYRSTISRGEQAKVVQIRLDDGQHAKDVGAIRFKWGFMSQDKSTFQFVNFTESKGVTFPSIGSNTAGAADPPTMSLTLVQTAENFKFSDFDVTKDGGTNRGTMYLVPAGGFNKSKEMASKNGDNYIGAYDGNKNYISADGFLKSNDKVSKNLPYAVYCDEELAADFQCMVEIQLPEPVNGDRNDNTFLFVVSSPYGTGASFGFELICKEGVQDCGTTKITSDEDGNITETKTDVISLKGMQISIDSTGRANTLYRRVESRLEPEMGDSALSATQYVIQLTGGGDDVLNKNLSVTSEWGIDDRLAY